MICKLTLVNRKSVISNHAFGLTGLSLVIYWIVVFSLTSCTHPSKKAEKLDIQGHRGCRGLSPENTIPAFIKAVQLGVNTIEMDVVISKDGKVVLSHDPYLSHIICLTADGKEITEENEKLYNLYTMTYDSIKKCDCGSKQNPRFPLQQTIKTYKPLLSDVIDSVEVYISQHHLPPVQYNIETKSTIEGDAVFHPAPNEFVERLLAVIKEKNIQNKVIIQSFDVRTLQVLKNMDTTITIALLVENMLGHENNVKALGFVPDIYSPYYELVTPILIEYAEKNHMKVIPWTVNTKAEMQKMIELGVDGIITDFPDSARQYHVH